MSDGPFGKAPDIGVGVSDAVLLVVSSIGFMMLAVTLYSIVITRLKSAEEIEEDGEDLNYDEKLANADVSTLSRAQRRARARHIMKQQRRIVPTASAHVPGRDMNDRDENLDARNNVGEDGNLQEGQGVESHPSRRLSRKERQKAAKAAEKEERRLFEETRQKEQHAAQEAAKREKMLREKEQAERVEQERRLRQAKKEEQDRNEYEEWITFLASDDGTKTLLVHEWIQQLESGSPVVQLRTLAEDYGLPLVAIEQRIQKLVDSARVTGILEPDGRFIYLSEAEMISLAGLVQSKDSMSASQVQNLLRTTTH